MEADPASARLALVYREDVESVCLLVCQTLLPGVWQRESRLSVCNEYKWDPGLTPLAWLPSLKAGMDVGW